MGNYLIPANSKKSMLILSLFNITDLIIFSSGCIVTFIFLLSIKASDVTSAILILMPALVCAFLVIPIPNQHNVRTLIANIYSYYSRRKMYYWKGWCNSYGKSNADE